jgi:hypothetical protein
VTLEYKLLNKQYTNTIALFDVEYIHKDIVIYVNNPPSNNKDTRLKSKIFTTET